MQKTDAGGIKPHNTDIHLTEWDCIVLDEYHFRAWNKNSKDLYDAKNDTEIIETIVETKELNDMNKERGEKAVDYYDEEQMPLTTNAYLYLSGTPFRALNNGEFPSKLKKFENSLKLPGVLFSISLIIYNFKSVRKTITIYNNNLQP